MEYDSFVLLSCLRCDLLCHFPSRTNFKLCGLYARATLNSSKSHPRLKCVKEFYFIGTEIYILITHENRSE